MFSIQRKFYFIRERERNGNKWMKNFDLKIDMEFFYDKKFDHLTPGSDFHEVEIFFRW